jgi:hypothetical protein
MKLSGRQGSAFVRVAGVVGAMFLMESDGQAQLRRVVADVQPVVSAEPAWSETPSHLTLERAPGGILGRS